jgi:hypothetical protein
MKMMQTKNNWQVTIQAAQVLTHPDGSSMSVPGYVQIDDISGGQNVWSKGPATLRAEGIEVPDFSSLPSGRYLWPVAVKLIEAK